jgi:hypothetical protein
MSYWSIDGNMSNPFTYEIKYRIGRSVGHVVSLKTLKYKGLNDKNMGDDDSDDDDSDDRRILTKPQIYPSCNYGDNLGHNPSTRLLPLGHKVNVYGNY